MTSSDMQDTPAGRRAAGADGPRSSQPKRRTFTAAYKLAMIEKYDAATEPGAKGALLRGEGLYDSHISYWRKARNSGSLGPRRLPRMLFPRWLLRAARPERQRMSGCGSGWRRRR